MKKNGYIALTISMVMALFVMILAISFGSSSLFTRTNVVNYADKQLSYFVARSCLNHALFQLANSLSYDGNETIQVSSNSCVLSTITTSGNNLTIQAKAQIGSAVTNLKLIVENLNLSTVSLEEIQSL